MIYISVIYTIHLYTFDLLVNWLSFLLGSRVNSFLRWWSLRCNLSWGIRHSKQSRFCIPDQSVLLFIHELRWFKVITAYFVILMQLVRRYVPQVISSGVNHPFLAPVKFNNITFIYDWIQLQNSACLI